MTSQKELLGLADVQLQSFKESFGHSDIYPGDNMTNFDERNSTPVRHSLSSVPKDAVL